PFAQARLAFQADVLEVAEEHVGHEAVLVVVLDPQDGVRLQRPDPVEPARLALLLHLQDAGLHHLAAVGFVFGSGRLLGPGADGALGADGVAIGQVADAVGAVAAAHARAAGLAAHFAGLAPRLRRLRRRRIVCGLAHAVFSSTAAYPGMSCFPRPDCAVLSRGKTSRLTDRG